MICRCPPQKISLVRQRVTVDLGCRLWPGRPPTGSEVRGRSSYRGSDVVDRDHEVEWVGGGRLEPEVALAAQAGYQIDWLSVQPLRVAVSAASFGGDEEPLRQVLDGLISGRHDNP